MVDFGLAGLRPEVVELQAFRALAEVREARHVADWRVHPDVEILVLGTRDREAEVRPVAADIPGLEPLGQPFAQLVRHFRLNRIACRPFEEEVAELPEVEEVVLGGAQLGRSVGQERARIAEFRGIVGRAAFLAVVAVLVVGPAARTRALDETVGQEQLALGIVELLDIGRERSVIPGEPLVDRSGQAFVLGGVRRVVVVVGDVKAPEVLGMLFAQRLDHGLRGGSRAFRREHGRRAVGVVGANVVALVAHHALKPYPDVGEDVLEQVA